MRPYVIVYELYTWEVLIRNHFFIIALISPKKTVHKETYFIKVLEIHILFNIVTLQFGFLDLSFIKIMQIKCIILLFYGNALYSICE